jgi:TonB family protein
VVLKLTIDATGRVRSARVLQDPGHGLGAAAVRTALRHFQFKPAERGGQPVACELTFYVTYELPPD